jgi:hypothetical protein
MVETAPLRWKSAAGGVGGHVRYQASGREHGMHGSSTQGQAYPCDWWARVARRGTVTEPWFQKLGGDGAARQVPPCLRRNKRRSHAAHRCFAMLLVVLVPPHSPGLLAETG